MDDKIIGYQLTCLYCFCPSFARTPKECVLNFLLHLKEEHKEEFDWIINGMELLKNHENRTRDK